MESSTLECTLEWITAIGTLLSALVALGVVVFNPIKNMILRARFKVRESITNWHSSWESELSKIPEERGGYVEVIIPIEQVWGGSSSNVEVIVKNLWEYKDGKKEIYKSFISSNLSWGNFEKRNIFQRFSKGVMRHCTLGAYRMDNEDNYYFTVGVAEKLGNPYLDQLSEDIPLGEYELELLIIGDNVSPLSKFIKLTILGGWIHDEEASFDSCFSVKVLNK